MQTFIKMMKEFLEMLFPWNNKDNSRSHAKSRLQLIIAHDRASINPDLLEAMREEILDVVARYVEVDREEMEFSLSNEQRITALTANLPIRQVRRAGELQEQVKNNSSLELQMAEVETVTKTEQKSEGKS